MGLEDRDGWKQAQERREAADALRPGRPGSATGRTQQVRGDHHALPRGLKWGPLGIVVFWLVIMAVVYGAIEHVRQPRH